MAKTSIEESKPNNEEKTWKRIPAKLKLAITIFLAISIVAIGVELYKDVQRSIEIAAIDESEYQRISMIVDSTKWTVSKSDFSLLRKAIDSTLSGNGYTKSSGGVIKLILESNSSYSLLGSFAYDSGYIDGFINGIYARIFFSESILRKGRTLTIAIADKKIVLYENE